MTSGIEDRRARRSETIALISVVIVVAIQFAAGIWWGATITANLNAMTIQLQLLNAEKYTSKDAQKDRDRQADYNKEVDRRLTFLETYGSWKSNTK